MKESDLYPALKQFLESQNYEVKGEVQNCDVLALRHDEPVVIVELKLILNLDVILQAVDRVSLSSSVYIGIPRYCKSFKKRRKRILKLLRMLGLGLIVIDPTRDIGSVEVILDPGPYQPRESRIKKNRLLGEFQKRVGDPNPGGSNRQGIMTVYRQRALSIANHLSRNGPEKASHIARTLNEPEARNILYRNVYGWFDRVDTGIYTLSPRGQKELPNWQHIDSGDPD